MAQADQQIQNDNGSNVRADLNNNFDALFSNNSGSSEPSVTTAFMWFADSANDALKIRNAANSAFITVGTLSETNLGLALKASPTFTGNVGVPAGTVSSLPIRRSDDTNTGIFFSAADTLDIATGGTRRAHFDTNGITIRDRKALRFRDTSNSNFVAIRAPDNAAADITLTLPSSDGNANDVLQSDGSGNLSFAALPQAVPTGSVHLMAGNNVPSGYLKCNGQAVSQTTYAALYQIIGATYGQTATTFNLPDLRGEFVRGWADDRSDVDAGRGFGTAQDQSNREHTHVVTDPGHGHSINDPGHFHNVAYTNSDNGDGVIEESGTGFNGFEPTENATTNISINLNHTGISIQNQGSEARPRNIAMMYVIKT
ncbi:phage tail protein [Limnobacter sp.]|uniref:phage tail protein n=1 Tax=Limnobacter sp. TaxID=2003368 RepID=UPI0025C5B89C|nr:phage tail protein [Limnobacter sp.]